jgi:hypothetical protein
MAKEEKHATTPLGLKLTVSAEVRTAFEIILYELAQQHAIDAEEASKSGQRSDELRYTIQAIVLAASCLEAFINQEAIQVLGQNFGAYDKGYIDAWGKNYKKRRGYPSLEDKWFEITKRIGNKEFDKRNKPFQDFHKLVELRNEILHNKAMPSSAPSPWPDAKGVVTQERAKFTAKAARTAVETMKAMLQQFYILTGKQKPVWLK